MQSPGLEWFLFQLPMCCGNYITSAFLQGNDTEREAFVLPPSEIIAGKIWKFQRCIYGLSDGPSKWYNRVEQELLKLGGRKNLYDQAMFQWNNTREILVIHVDDFVYCTLILWTGIRMCFVSLRSARKKRIFQIYWIECGTDE